MKLRHFSCQKGTDVYLTLVMINISFKSTKKPWHLCKNFDRHLRLFTYATEAYSGLCQTSRVEIFTKTFNAFSYFCKKAAYLFDRAWIHFCVQKTESFSMLDLSSMNILAITPLVLHAPYPAVPKALVTQVVQTLK